MDKSSLLSPGGRTLWLENWPSFIPAAGEALVARLGSSVASPPEGLAADARVVGMIRSCSLMSRG